MKTCIWRGLGLVAVAWQLAGCGDRVTKEALEKATTLSNSHNYTDANNALVDALKARESTLTGPTEPADQAAREAMTRTVQADPAILKIERAQIPIYLHLEKPELASIVYADILKGNPGDPVVHDLLSDPDLALRTGAIRILGLMAKPENIDDLAAASKDKDQDARRAAVAGLGLIKDPRTVTPLLAALKDPYWFVRSEAAEALGLTQNPLVIRALLDAANDPDSAVQASVENALLHLCRLPGASADEFASRLDDPNPKIVLTTALCLSLRRDPRAVPVLLRLVSSSDPPVRLAAVKGLGESGDISVSPILRQILTDPDLNMRGWAIIGLGKLRDRDAFAQLRAIATDPAQPDNIRAVALDSATHINSVSITPTDPGTVSAKTPAVHPTPKGHP